MPRAGLYAWGGPGTIRLLNTKYHTPRIDEASFMSLYEPAYLEKARRTLGISDMWVTYSWGFSDRTEKPDRNFIIRRLANFHEQDIRTYAYVQGLNVVTDEFAGQDIFCRDVRGGLLPYSKGRALTCPNKPEARRIIVDRVLAACQEDFAGIFIDNLVFGLPPFFVRRDYASFFGCACDDCRRAFRTQYGYELPVAAIAGEAPLTDYLIFRCRTMFDLLKELSDVARAGGKQFGINLYDPYLMSAELYNGFRMSQIAPLLDYYLIENHALSYDVGIDNTHLTPLIRSEPRKPVFVVSYRKGISYDSAFGQREVNVIWSEAEGLEYSPCLKATEYVTRGTWHALDLTALTRPAPVSLSLLSDSADEQIELKPSRLAERQLVRLISRHYAHLSRMSFENRRVAHWITRTQIMVPIVRNLKRYNVGSSS